MAGLAFRFFSKLLANITPFCTKEAFVAMTTTVKQIYKDRTRNYQLPSIATEISFKKRPNHNLLQTCRLITSTCRDLPKHWSRYPASIVEEIMQAKNFFSYGFIVAHCRLEITLVARDVFMPRKYPSRLSLVSRSSNLYINFNTNQSKMVRLAWILDEM